MSTTENQNSSYYSIIPQSKVRQVIAEKRIEVCRLLSEKISQEILQEANLCHVMAYISLSLLNSASGGIVTAWNVNEYMIDIKEELKKQLYLTEGAELVCKDLYNLSAGTSETEYRDAEDNIQTLHYITLKKEGPDGFLFFWVDDNEDKKIDDTRIDDYVINQINVTEQEIADRINKASFKEIDVDITISNEVKNDIEYQDVDADESTPDVEVIVKSFDQKQTEFSDLVNKYNSYKEVRI